MAVEPTDPFGTPMQIDYATIARERTKRVREAVLVIVGSIGVLVLVTALWWFTGIIYVGFGIFIGLAGIFKGIAELLRIRES